MTRCARRGTQPKDHAPRFPRCAPHPWNELALAVKLARYKAKAAGDKPEDQISTRKAMHAATMAKLVRKIMTPL